MGNHPSRRHVMAGLAVLPLLAACNGTGASSDSGTAGAGASSTHRMTIGMSYIPDIQFAPLYVALDKGYFRDAGLDVTLRHHGANEQLTGALVSGTETVLYAGADEMMQARSQGVKVVNFGTVYQQYPVVAISRKESGITSPAQLKGKKIGVPGKYGETWFGLLALLKQGGLTEADVTIQTIGYTQQAALTTRKVDAVIGYANNEAVRLADAGVAVNTLKVTGSLVSIGLNTLDTTRSSQEPQLKGVVEALRRAVSDIEKDPAAAVTLAKKHVPTLTGPAQEKAALATLTATMELIGGPAEFGTQNTETWSRMADFMVSSGLVKTKVPADQAYVTLVD